MPAFHINTRCAVWTLVVLIGTPVALWELLRDPERLSLPGHGEFLAFALVLMVLAAICAVTEFLHVSVAYVGSAVVAAFYIIYAAVFLAGIGVDLGAGWFVGVLLLLLAGLVVALSAIGRTMDGRRSSGRHQGRKRSSRRR